MGKSKPPSSRPAQSKAAASAPASRSFDVILFALLAYHIAMIGAGVLLGPHARAWGVNFPAYVFGAPTVMLLAVLPPVYLLLVRTRQGAALVQRPSFAPAMLALAAVVFLAVTLPVLFGGGVPALLGDGSFYRSEVLRMQRITDYAPDFIKPSAMLTGYAIAALARETSTQSASEPFIILSAFSLAVVVTSILFALRKHGVVPALAATGAFVLIPASLMYCGYVELYAPSLAFASMMLLGAVVFADSGRHAWMMLAGMLLSVMMSLSAIILLPVMLYVAWMRMPAADDRRVRPSLALFAAGVLLVLAAAYGIAGVRTGSVYLLRLLPGEHVSDGISYGWIGYSALSLPHVTDMLNMLLLMGGSWMVLLAAVYARKATRALLPQKMNGLIALSMFLPFTFLLTANTALGMGRDWDLVSLACLLLSFAGLLAFGALRRHDGSAALRVLPMIVLVQLFQWNAWVSANTDPRISAARADDLVTLDAGLIRPDNTHSGYENLRKHEVTQRNIDGVFTQLVRLHSTGFHKGDTYNKLLMSLSDADAAYNIAPWFDTTSALLLRDVAQPHPAGDYRRISAQELGEYSVRLVIVAANRNLRMQAQAHTDAFARAVPRWKEEPLARIWLREEATRGDVVAAVAAAIDSSTTDAQLVLAGAHMLASAQCYEPAAQLLALAIRREPSEYPEAYLQLATIDLALQRPDEARSALNACLARCTDPDARQKAAMMLANMERMPR